MAFAEGSDWSGCEWCELQGAGTNRAVRARPNSTAPPTQSGAADSKQVPALELGQRRDSPSRATSNSMAARCSGALPTRSRFRDNRFSSSSAMPSEKFSLPAWSLF